MTWLFVIKVAAGALVVGFAAGYLVRSRRVLKCPRCDRRLIPSRVREWKVWKCVNCGVTLDEFEVASL